MRWEHTFLTRIGAVEKENWLNKHDAGNCFGGPAAARLSHTPEVNVKRHNTRMQNEKPYNTPETINKQKLTRQNNSSWRLSVDKMVATRLERGVNSNAIKVICEHCGKSVGKPNYARHHGERCKHRPEA
jgi:hypothetical protein